MLKYETIEEYVRQDFNVFDFNNRPVRKNCEYNVNKHIAMCVNLVQQAFSYKQCYSNAELNSFIHGLNHLFFNGLAAGQWFERNRKDGC